MWPTAESRVRSIGGRVYFQERAIWTANHTQGGRLADPINSGPRGPCPVSGVDRKSDFDGGWSVDANCDIAASIDED